MSRYLWSAICVIVVVILGWMCLTLALENDGLKQVVSENQRSTRMLLSYVAVATRCDVTPQEVAGAVNGTVYRAPDGTIIDVSRLSFKAEFKGGRIQNVQIVDAGKSAVCGGK